MDVKDPSSRLDVLTNGVAFLSDAASSLPSNPATLPFADAFQRRQAGVNGNDSSGNSRFNVPTNGDSSKSSAAQNSGTPAGSVVSSPASAKPGGNTGDTDDKSDPATTDAANAGGVPVPAANAAPAPPPVNSTTTDETSLAISGAPASLVCAWQQAISPDAGLAAPTPNDAAPTAIPTGLQAALTEPVVEQTSEQQETPDASTALTISSALGNQGSTPLSTNNAAGVPAISPQVRLAKPTAEQTPDASVDGAQGSPVATSPRNWPSATPDRPQNVPRDDGLKLATPALNFAASGDRHKEANGTEDMTAVNSDAIPHELPAMHAAVSGNATQDAAASSAAGADAAAQNPATSNGPAEVPVSSQVHEALMRAGTLDQRLTIVLRPPELGRVQVDVTRHDGQLTARLQTETATAHRLLSEHLPQLQETFAQMGLNADQVQVVRNDPSTANGSGERLADGWSDQQAGHSQQHQQQGTESPEPQWIEEPEATDGPARNVWTRTALNLRV